MRLSLAVVIGISMIGLACSTTDCAVGFGIETDNPASSGNIDPAVSTTATEFTRRLAQYSGTLEEMRRGPTGVTARWSSGKCNSFEAEVIDLLLSVNRTQQESVTIRGTRTCDGNTASYELSGADFQRYRTGQINDPDVLNGIKR